MLLIKHTITDFFSYLNSMLWIKACVYLYIYQSFLTHHFCLSEFYVLLISLLKDYVLYKAFHDCSKLKLHSSTLFPSFVSYHTNANNM